MKKLEATQQNALNPVPRKNDKLCDNREGGINSKMERSRGCISTAL
jgi:hypothetical protein